MAVVGIPIGIGRPWSPCIQILSLVVSAVTQVAVAFDRALSTTEAGHPAGSLDFGLGAAPLGSKTTKFLFDAGGM